MQRVQDGQRVGLAERRGVERVLADHIDVGCRDRLEHRIDRRADSGSRRWWRAARHHQSRSSIKWGGHSHQFHSGDDRAGRTVKPHVVASARQAHRQVRHHRLRAAGLSRPQRGDWRRDDRDLHAALT